MTNTVWIIMKKEFARFFGDKRLVFTAILLPGLMIYCIYHFMGTALDFQNNQDKTATVEAVAMPASIQNILESADIEIKAIAHDKLSKAKKEVENQELELCLVFPEDFDEQIASYSVESGEEAPQVEIYYNSAANTSLTAYQMVVDMLDGYEGQLCNKFDVNPGETKYDLATNEDTMGAMFAAFLPMLLMAFLYSGCISVAPESIAGEKERGTIATLLVTPIPRGNIALGKIGALSVIALLSGMSSTLGTILSLPAMMQDELGDSAVSTNVYHVTDYLLLLVVILSTVLLMVTVISLLSAFANTIKEAQTLVSPLMIIVMLLGITAMFGEDAQQGIWYYFIPLYNSVQCMVGIFTFQAVLSKVAVTVAANLILSCLGVWGLARMFHSERIMF